MSIPETQKRAVSKYRKNHYDTITLTMEKGKRDVIKAYAEKQKESINCFVNTAINERIEKLETGNNSPEQEKPPKNIV